MAPEQIALDALAQLGETPGDNPIAQLRAIANDAMRAAANVNLGALHRPGPLDEQALATAHEYERVLDRASIALVAAARIDRAQGPRDFLEAAARDIEANPGGKAMP